MLISRGINPNEPSLHDLKSGAPLWSTFAGADWQNWLTGLFPTYVRYPFADRHRHFWSWVWSIKPGQRPDPFVAIWPRGGAKSTSAELAVVAIGLRGIRPYALYISGTQEQADKHVGTIGSAMESVGVERAVNRYGNSRGWRRNRLHTSGGFTVDALGLDTAARGIKVDASRPGLIVLDDIDELADSDARTRSKIDALTNTVIPTGSNDVAVLCVQNIIHKDSVFARLADGRADFLAGRIVSGPFAAIDGLTYEQRERGITITGGVATWEGQSLKECQGFIDLWGFRAFLRECQHLVNIDREGAMWSRSVIDRFRATDEPEHLSQIVVAVDPSAGSKDSSDEAGIVIAGKDRMRHGYVLADYTMRGTPAQWATRAIMAYAAHGANVVVGESNNGGEMVEAVIRGITREAVADELERFGHSRDLAVSGQQVPYVTVWASRSKETRAEPASMLYSQGRVHHVGGLPALEAEMVTWIPGEGKSPNRVDALVWALSRLNLVGGADLPANQPAQESRWRIGEAADRPSWKRY